MRCRIVLIAVLALAACSSSGSTAKPSTASTVPPSTAAEPKAERVLVSGAATVDGKPFDAQFLGAVVREHGLVTSCQADIPAVKGGKFEVTVMSVSDGAGCGRLGTEILLWTFVGDQRLFSTSTIPWPDDGTKATFDAKFETAKPQGAHPAVTELAGEVYRPDNSKVQPFATVAAVINDTLCGVGTIRTNGDFTGFSLGVVGPDAIKGCAQNGTITFRVDDQPAKETLKNDQSLHRRFDLTLP
jgi:hypothetical protein